MKIEFSCPECAHKYKVGDEFAGKKVRCRECGATMPVPKAAAPAKSSSAKSSPGKSSPARPAPPKSAPKKAAPDIDFEVEEEEEEDEDDFGLPAAKPARGLPPRVGGKSSSRGRPARSARYDDDDDDDDDDDYRPSRRRGSSLQGKGWMIFAGVVASLLPIGFLIGLAAPPIGIAIVGLFTALGVLTGVALSLWGGLKCLATAWEEDPMCLILWFFVPFYSLYFIISRWDQTWLYVAANFGGAVLWVTTLFLGLFAIGALRAG